MGKDSQSLVKRLFKFITLEHCVIRFIMAWCFVSIIHTTYIISKKLYALDDIAFLKNGNFTVIFIQIVCMFITLYSVFEIVGLRNKRLSVILEKVVLMAVTLVYAIICVVYDTDIYFCIGITALLAFAVCYSVKDIEFSEKKLPRWLFISIMSVLGVAFVLFTGGCTVARYLSYSSPNFDCGLFSQMFHYMKTTLTMNVTSERDRLLSHLAVHVSPAFYLILPFYAIFSSTITLQIMQAVVIALGLIPLVGICRNHKLSNIETTLMGICYVAYPVMSGGCFYDIHENFFLPLFLLTFLYFIEKDSWKGIIISMLLVFSVKEDAAIYVAFIALYMILGRKMYKKGLTVLACALGYFAFTTVLLSFLGSGIMSYRFDNMMLDNGGSIFGIIKTVIMHPAYIVTQIMNQEKFEFILQVFAPLLFMPLFSKKWQRFILVGPLVFFNLMSDYVYFHNIFFHYVFGSGTLLIYLTVINVADMDKKLRSKVLPMAAVASVMFFSSVMWKKTEVITRLNKSYNQETYAAIDEGLSMIPDDASVIATTFLCAKLSKRDILYELHYTDKEAEYVALDLRGSPTEYSADTYLNDSRYETVYYAPLQIAVFRRVDWNLTYN